MPAIRFASGLLGAVVFAALGAAAQSAPQQAPPKPPAKQEAKKPKKVWTEDDVIRLRRPVDHYEAQKAREAEEKAKAEAAAKAAAAEAAKEGDKPPQGPIDPATGKPYLDPESLEGQERLLANLEFQLKNMEESLQLARREMAETRDPDRWESAKLKVDTFEENIRDLSERIEQTRARIAELKAKKPGDGEAPPRPPDNLP